MINLDYVVLFSVAVVLRYGTSLWPYSGQGVPPMHGDYEAQRHWQEITINLPLVDWYNQTQDNDLQYWGLDYPPVTAYHSYLVGKVAHNINTSYVQLHSSRGIESQEHKIFMRLSVIVADLLVLFPAIRLFSGPNINLASLFLSTYPGLILIDHGHFQYNGISLGLFIMAVALVTRDYDVIGSVIFCVALNYKQMELYHALPFFFYLLGKSLHQPSIFRKMLKLIVIGIAVIGTFCLIWLPFILAGPDTCLQVVRRVFPIDRGVYEDKVANFWCTIDIILKLKQNLETQQIGLLCLVTTFVLSLISNIHLLIKPSSRNFVFAQVNTSLIFFLFSFHVHEKTILLATIPAILAAHHSQTKSTYIRHWLPWFLTISVFSMVPLLLKDGLLIPAACLTTFFIILNSNLDLLVTSQVRPMDRISSPLPVEPDTLALQILGFMRIVSYIGAVLLTILHLSVQPPARFPYLWPTLICVYSCLHFLVFVLVFHIEQFYPKQQTTTKIKTT